MVSQYCSEVRCCKYTMLVRTATDAGGVGSVSIPSMTPSGTDDCLTPSWHALDEWANVLDSDLVLYVVQCLSQVREGLLRGLQRSDPTLQDIPQMFDWVEIRTICWPLQRRNLNLHKVVVHI